MTHRLALALIVPILLVSGCADDEPSGEPSGDKAESTSSGSSSPMTEVDYPDEGLDLVDPPEVQGAYAKALQTYVDFERGRRLAAREGRIGPLLRFSAVAPVVDPYRKALASYGGGGYDGDVAVEFLDVRPRDLALVLDVCVDATQLVVPGGAPTLLGEPTRAPQRIEVRNLEGPWRVTKAERVDGSC
jgi:hypothetical protein